MKLLADFRNYAYTLPSVRGLTIHMQDRTTIVRFPKNRYDQVPTSDNPIFNSASQIESQNWDITVV